MVIMCSSSLLASNKASFIVVETLDEALDYMPNLGREKPQRMRGG
jgi:hypothetical protein